MACKTNLPKDFDRNQESGIIPISQFDVGDEVYMIESDILQDGVIEESDFGHHFTEESWMFKVKTEDGSMWKFERSMAHTKKELILKIFFVDVQNKDVLKLLNEV